MSPEQARGRPIDKRTDIWAFGCCFFEALTGKRAFLRETVSDTIAAILDREPDRQRFSGTVRTLLRRCLEKDATDRLHDIADARLELQDALDAPSESAAPPAKRPGWRVALPWVVAAIAVALAADSLVRDEAPHGVTRVNIDPYDSLAPLLNPLAISPDGGTIVYATNMPSTGVSTPLYRRPMDQLEATPIPGTEGALSPFFSADGQWIGFWSLPERALKKVSVSGGGPVTICGAEDPRGMSWGPDDTILFPRNAFSALWKVSAHGGTPEPVTTHNIFPQDISSTRSPRTNS